jgi:transposase-like protein
MQKSVNYYPDDFKIKVVRHYLESDDGFNKTAKLFNLSCHALVRNWLLKYKEEQEQFPMAKVSKYNPNYSEELKIEVVRHYIETGDSYLKTAKKFNLPSVLSVRNWVDKYRNPVAGVYNGVITFGGDILTTTMNKPTKENDQSLPGDPIAIAKRIQQLEDALINEQLKNISLNTMIDVAEKELNIQIRKKSGAKQSRK